MKIKYFQDTEIFSGDIVKAYQHGSVVVLCYLVCHSVSRCVWWCITVLHIRLGSSTQYQATR